MKSCGVIAEYNPFHNGHQFQLQKAREVSRADVMVAVMSGNFLQRGEPAIIDKWQRAEAALNYGADLVIELPTVFAVQSADYFATGAVKLLQGLGVDSLSFGTDQAAELDYHHFATLVADHQTEIAQAFGQIKNNGMSYPQQLTAVYRQLFPDWQLDFSSPNHILGMSYAKANQSYPRPLKLFPIKREGTNHHQQEIKHLKFASGTAIRQGTFKGAFEKIRPVVSAEMFQTLTESSLVSWETAWPLLKYRLLTAALSELQEIYQMVEGIEYRLVKFANQAQSFAEFIQLVKTKRFTWTRLQRLCTYVLLNLTEEQVQQLQAQPYLRVLGFNQRGREYLKQQRKDARFPLITKVSRESQGLLQLDLKAGQLYQLLKADEEAQDYGRRPIYLEK